MTGRVLAALVLVAAAFAARGQVADSLKLKLSEIELGASHERLSNGRGDWRSTSLEGAHKFAERQTLYGGVRDTERFGLADTEVWAGYYHPLARDWTALVEASTSGEHHVLPRNSLFGQLAWQLGGGWSLNAGLRHSEYNRTAVDLLVLGAERYWGNFRAAYTMYSGRPEGAPSGLAHRFVLNYYYGDGSSVGASVTTGREVENVGPPTGILVTEVRNLTIYGRHWLSADWGLSWEVLAHEQGSLYRREGFRLGLRYRF